MPLYVGRMIHLFDHRAASVEVNAENLHNAALSGDISAEQKADPAFVPTPQYWVPIREVSFPSGLDWTIAFRDIARATDARTMIAAAVPTVGLGNTAPAIFPEDVDNDQSNTTLLLANLGATVLDFVVRQKAQSTHLNWYIVEQLPVVPLDRYEAVRFGPKTAGKIVQEAVLELTYTAHDMAPFARDMGYVDEAGEVKPALHLERRAPPDPALQARRRVLSPLQRHRPRRHPLYLLDLPHRRTPREGRLWGRVPILRALPRLDERAGGG